MEVLARVSRRFAETTLDLGVVERIAAEIGEVMSATVAIALDRVVGEAPSHGVVVPLRAHGRNLGILIATRAPEEHAFTPDDRQLLDELVDRAAIAIENSRLYRANQQARSRAEQLYTFAHAVATADRIEQVFDAALESLQRAVGARRTAILTSDAEGAMHFRAWRGLSLAYRDAAEDRSPWPRHITAPQPIVVRDVATDPLTRGDTLYRAEAIGSLAFFPLFLHGRALGMISVYFDEPHELTAHDLVLATSIANHLASVIHRYDTLAKLEDSVRYGELFAGILAHDLRNPLGTIITATELIARRHASAGEPLLQPLGHVKHSCERMSRMIDQLLDFSRARAGGGIEIRRRSTDLAEVMGRALAEVHALFPAHQVMLDARGNCGGHWDSDRLQQICASLIANAVQHGGGGGKAAVGVELDGTSHDAVAVRVHNDGAIPPAILPTVFDAFSSAERRREHSRGLGLGLFIVREVVAAHGGTVHVTSSSDHGTTFALRLPRS